MELHSDCFDLHQGSAPVLVSMPHVGIGIPDELINRLTPKALELTDTDWHVDSLYVRARELGCSMLKARWSRYVIDLNRAPEDTPMYAGKPNTGLLPTLTFDGEPLYLDGEAPESAESTYRLERYWRPYHEALQQELERIRRRHGYAILWDGHSIRSQVPRLFDGRLPDLNLGTNDGASCAPTLSAALVATAGKSSDYSHVLNGRFKGGYTTRHYGQPARNIHAVQLEVTQISYLDTEHPPFAVSTTAGPRFARTVGSLVETAVHWKAA
jgi:N-formylglutamate amidohydrolase